jgi:hypothetical protein
MSWIRRRARTDKAAGQPADRLPDPEFLALIRARLEAFAPGVTAGAEIRGNALLSPDGWAVAVTPPQHGGGRHYDLVVRLDVNDERDLSGFADCVVAMSADPRDAADAWVQTTGACLLELLDQRGHFADRYGPDHPRGVPGRHAVVSGVVGLGLDPDESRRVQGALLDVNVLHRIADTLTSGSASPGATGVTGATGVKVFYGGRPGAMQAEIRVDGERHEAASAAMAALDLPEPSVFTAVRYYALLLPSPPERRTIHARPAHHAHGADCCCGDEPDPDHPGFEFPLPHLVAELSEEERAKRLRVDTGALMVADGVGNFLKVRLPIPLDDGRTVVYLAWVALRAEVIEDVVARTNAGTLPGHRFEGLLCNAIGPWAEEVLRAPVVLVGQPVKREGRVPYCEVVESGDPLLSRALSERWPAEFVLG